MVLSFLDGMLCVSSNQKSGGSTVQHLLCWIAISPWRCGHVAPSCVGCHSLQFLLVWIHKKKDVPGSVCRRPQRDLISMPSCP